MPQQGIKTGEFGAWLTAYFRGLEHFKDYRVYFDHGNREIDANVVATKGFFGTSVTNLNRIADADIAIVDPDGIARLIIEIEERPCAPKKILGNLLANLICNRYAVIDHDRKCAQAYIDICHKTELIIAGIMPAKGQRLAKITEVVLPRVRQLSGLENGIAPCNAHFVFRDTIDATIQALQQCVHDRFPRIDPDSDR